MSEQMGDLYSLAQKRKIQLNSRKSVEEILKNELYPLLPFAPQADVLNTIQIMSATPYEQSKCIDKTIVFLADTNGFDTKVVDVPLDDQINIPFTSSNSKDIKMLRKLINPLPTNCCYIFGKKGNDNIYYAIGSTQEDNLEDILYYKCTIIDHLYWQLALHMGNTEIGLFTYEYYSYKGYHYKRKPEEVETKIQQEEHELNKKMEEMKLDKAYIETINKIHSMVFTYLQNTKCGTSFAIFKSNEKARTEAIRLASDKSARGYLLKNFSDLTESKIQQMINIDGGIIVDTNNICYAYGCIFDGKVTQRFCGERASGARHNSMKMYVENQRKGTCVGIVFSEDGGFEIYSN